MEFITSGQMKGVTKNKPYLKGWNIRLKVSPEEEKKIKMRAIKKGMGISDYIKQVLLNSLSTNKTPIQEESGEQLYQA